jgi:hypothetical protein
VRLYFFYKGHKRSLELVTFFKNFLSTPRNSVEIATEAYNESAVSLKVILIQHECIIHSTSNF